MSASPLIIENGDLVQTHYIGQLDDASEFDRSSPDRPLRFTVGSGQVIPGFDQAVRGKSQGDKFSVKIAPEQAYGLRDNQLVFPVALKEVPPNLELAAGMPLHVATDQGELEVLVDRLDDEFVYLDANHPLAGKSLTFHLEIVDVSRPGK